MAAVDVKAVCLKSACDTVVLCREVMQPVTQGAQDTVAELTPVQSVDGVELFDVQNERVHRRIGVVVIHTVGVLEEEFAVVQTREVVGLGSRNK